MPLSQRSCDFPLDEARRDMSWVMEPRRKSPVRALARWAVTSRFNKVLSWSGWAEKTF